MTLNYQIITQQNELESLCIKLAKAPILALDTEFVRTRTYYARLGLLQINDGQNVSLIDPFLITDWQSFINVMKNNNQKCFHACSEDLEVFLHDFGFAPEPLFDTQIVAAFLDNPLTAGYSSLVKKYLNTELKKSETLTDWLQRPLTDKQFQYAADDVIYLLPLVDKLKELITEKGWLNAAYEEAQHLIQRKLGILEPKQAYTAIKHAYQLNQLSVTYLQRLAEWRLNYARQHDVAVNFVVHEDVLFKVAKYCPTSLAELEQLGMRGKEIRLHGNTILDMLKKPVTEMIETIKQIQDTPNYKTQVKRLKNIAQKIASDTGLSTDLLISKRQINQYIQWSINNKESINKEPELISGWRGELFKPYL